MTDLIRRVTFNRANKDNAPKKTLPDFGSGDTIGVYVRVKEGEKERVQLFRGVVIKVQGSGVGRSFTVRKVSAGVGVERTFPLGSPAIDRIEVIAHGKIRRSRLFFLRGLKGRSARLDSELVMNVSEPGVGAADEVASSERGAGEGTISATEPGAKKASAKKAPKKTK
jgi:large subunit ribosomal protein L19